MKDQKCALIGQNQPQLRNKWMTIEQVLFFNNNNKYVFWHLFTIIIRLKMLCKFEPNYFRMSIACEKTILTMCQMCLLAENTWVSENKLHHSTFAVLMLRYLKYGETNCYYFWINIKKRKTFPISKYKEKSLIHLMKAGYSIVVFCDLACCIKRLDTVVIYHCKVFDDGFAVRSKSSLFEISLVNFTIDQSQFEFEKFSLVTSHRAFLQHTTFNWLWVVFICNNIGKCIQGCSTRARLNSIGKSTKSCSYPKS